MRGEVGCAKNEDEQILTSAEHAGVVGGLICTRALLRWANEKQLISCKHDETMLDELFDVKKCNFFYPYEPQILFNLMRNQYLFRNLRYVSINRSKMCQGFCKPALTSFLNEDENLRRFSFIMNNQASSNFDDLDEDPDNMGSTRQIKKKVRSRRLGRFNNIFEKEIQETGVKDDFDIIKILDAATLHPKLEIIQICQCMQDYFEAMEFV